LEVQGFIISAIVFSSLRLWGIAHALRDSLFFIKVCSYLAVEKYRVKSIKTLEPKSAYLGTELPLNIKLIFSEERRTAYEDLEV
jgi:hypothetical protein